MTTLIKPKLRLNYKLFLLSSSSVLSLDDNDNTQIAIILPISKIMMPQKTNPTNIILPALAKPLPFCISIETEIIKNPMAMQIVISIMIADVLIFLPLLSVEIYFTIKIIRNINGDINNIKHAMPIKKILKLSSIFNSSLCN